MKFYMNSEFKYSKSPEITPHFIQYSTETIELHLPYNREDNDGEGRNVIVNIIRPDGFKTNEMFASFEGENPDVPGIYIWKAKITPYHTAIIPGTGSTGSMLISFMMKEWEGAVLADILTSPIVKITVQRSIEPNQEFLPYSVSEDLDKRINELERSTFDHTALTSLSRNKPNQHSIGSITGLQQKVDIHISEDEPIKNVDTWFDINEIDDEVTESTRWDKICSTPIIFENQLVNCNAFAVNEPLKMVVIGNVNDSIYRQELHSDEWGSIRGEIILYISSNYADIASVEILLQPIAGENAFSVVEFKNTGNVEIFDFTALSIEVFR